MKKVRTTYQLAESYLLKGAAILDTMQLDIQAIQAALRADHLDGWLLYDFNGSNPIAKRLAGLSCKDILASRRWYYLIPATGQPRGLVHAIERQTLDALPGEKFIYLERETLEKQLKILLGSCRHIAMEYSPECAIPYISRVDAGTIELLRRLGINVSSSGDLVQRFEASWDAKMLTQHQAASERLYRIKDRTFETIRKAIRDGHEPTEYEIQQQMVSWFKEEGLISDSAPVVATQEHSASPHYMPSATSSRAICRDQVVLLDLWGKLDEPGAVFADITWVGYVGAQPPSEVCRAFEAIRLARDEAVSTVQSAVRKGRDLRGWEIDQITRCAIDRAGYGNRILHRTGHSLGEEVHGNGVHLDNYETRDERRILPGTGFTIEPGIYFESFGVRTEINMYVSESDATVTGPLQSTVVALAE